MRQIATIFLLVIPAFAQQAEKLQAKHLNWGPLQTLIGQWKGAVSGQPGNGTSERSYSIGVGGTFMVAEGRSVYPPQTVNPSGETHVDHTLIGFDKTRKKYVMRQFHVEGFVNQYVLDEIAPYGKKLVWVTEAIENIPPGWRARETYLIRDSDHFTEAFDLAAPGKDFEPYSRTEFTRMK